MKYLGNAILVGAIAFAPLFYIVTNSTPAVAVSETAKACIAESKDYAKYEHCLGRKANEVQNKCKSIEIKLNKARAEDRKNGKYLKSPIGDL